MNDTLQHQLRHLVTDEPVILFDKRDTEMSFRVRIWRGKDATPIVLASAMKSDAGELCSPFLMSGKLANYILGPMLGHPESMMVYFEDQESSDGVRVLEQVCFEFYGNVHRLKMYRPTRTVKEWWRLESILCDRIKR